MRYVVTTKTRHDEETIIVDGVSNAVEAVITALQGPSHEMDMFLEQVTIKRVFLPDILPIKVKQ